jgi:hypothetical protein
MDAKIQNLTFGVELELHLPREISRHEAARRVSVAIGKPVDCPEYTHHDGPNWKVIMDTSLQGINAWEFISPVLKGDAGLAELKIVLETLTALGATVGSDCGTHVHVGVGRNPDVNLLKRLLKAYQIFEGAIDTVQPRSRRANNHRLLATLANLTGIDAAQDSYSLFRMLTNGRDRYYKFNVLALRRHPTVEFRHHSGTLEYPKLTNWILFCLRFVAASMDATIAVPVTEGGTQQTNRARYGSKSWQIGQLLLRPEGCTASEAMRLVGWPSVSMVQQARICGLQLIKERMGRNVRFYARAVSASTQIASGPATMDRLLTMIGASQAERDFYAQRAAHFAAQRQAA